jgi:hypothetical protein
MAPMPMPKARFFKPWKGMDWSYRKPRRGPSGRARWGFFTRSDSNRRGDARDGDGGPNRDGAGAIHDDHDRPSRAHGARPSHGDDVHPSHGAYDGDGDGARPNRTEQERYRPVPDRPRLRKGKGVLPERCPVTCQQRRRRGPQRQTNLSSDVRMRETPCQPPSIATPGRSRRCSQTVGAMG